MNRYLPLALFAALLAAACGPDNRGQDDADSLATEEVDTAGMAPPRLVEAWQLTEGLSRPESALYDPTRDVVYVSNIVGDPSEADGKGYIMRVRPDGTVVDSAWVAGLDAPKGLAMFGDKLYVSDLDDLVEIDAGLGEVLNRYPGAGAQFLNDVTTDATGYVYVSDSKSDFVYRLRDTTFAVWLDDPMVRNPNGVYVHDNELIIAAGDSTDRNRYLQRVSLDGTEIAPLHDRTPLGGIDAVEPDGRGGFFLSDWGAGTVSHVDGSGKVTALLTLTKGTADFDYVPEQEMIYLPVMMSDRLVAYRVAY
ncbi:MAG: hypothetical protein WBA12_05870 [Catalinimonas sp.]